MTQHSGHLHGALADAQYRVGAGLPENGQVRVTVAGNDKGICLFFPLLHQRQHTGKRFCRIHTGVDVLGRAGGGQCDHFKAVSGKGLLESVL